MELMKKTIMFALVAVFTSGSSLQSADNGLPTYQQAAAAESPAAKSSISATDRGLLKFLAGTVCAVTSLWLDAANRSCFFVPLSIGAIGIGSLVGHLYPDFLAKKAEIFKSFGLACTPYLCAAFMFGVLNHPSARYARYSY